MFHQQLYTQYRRQLASVVVGALLLQGTAGLAQRKTATPAKGANAISAIQESDLKRDLFTLASDHFKGREAGTLDELKASVWLAEQARAMGLQPAGDDGTYFQFFHLQRTRISETSRLSIGNRQFTHGKDAVIFTPAIASVDAPLVFVGEGTKEDLDKVDVKGKAVAMQLSGTAPADLSPARYILGMIRQRSADLIKAGAAAVIFVSSEYGQPVYNRYGGFLERGRYDLAGGPNTRVFQQAPVIWLPVTALNVVKQPNQQFTNLVNVESFSYPSVNVVAKVPGTDPTLSKEYVLFSGHQDHDGIRRPVDGDSIYNGADDNATVTVALMAIGRAFVAKPGRRSALFVWHGAEERGLLGSRYYASNPTVPKESLVAVLNGDMIGRNDPDSAALLGSQPPHRNSDDLVNIALAANQSGPKFKLDTLWDRADHPEGWYFRSDHLSYARVGVQGLFFTTLLHKDYHTPKDEADRIDIRKLAKMTRWMYLTGWDVANRPDRPRLVKDFKLER